MGALGFVWLNLVRSPEIAERLISVSKASHDSSTGKLKHWLTFDKFKQSATIAQNDPTQTGNRVRDIRFSSSFRSILIQQNWQQRGGPSSRGGRQYVYSQQHQQNYARELLVSLPNVILYSTYAGGGGRGGNRQ